MISSDKPMAPTENPATARVTVADIIAQYQQAFAVDDHAAAAKSLELLEHPAFLNANDWDTIQAFFTEKKIRRAAGSVDQALHQGGGTGRPAALLRADQAHREIRPHRRGVRLSEGAQGDFRGLAVL